MNRFQYARDMYVGLSATCVATFFLVATFFQVSHKGDPYGISGRTLPLLVAIILLAIGLYVFIYNYIHMRKACSHNDFAEDKADRKKRFIRSGIYIAAIAVYIVCFSYVDYIFSSIFMLVFGMWLSGFKNRIAFVFIAIFLPVIIYYLFSEVMEIPLPESILGIY